VTLALAGVVDVVIQLHQNPAEVAWQDVWLATLTVTVSAVVCGILGAAAGAVGRSMTFAMAVAAGFFPVDNGLGYVLPLLQNATQERVWADLSTYLLGPTLNHLPSVLMGRPAGELVPPQLPVGATHSLLVIAGYVAVFVTAAALVTWRCDTQEGASEMVPARPAVSQLQVGGAPDGTLDPMWSRPGAPPEEAVLLGSSSAPAPARRPGAPPGA